MRVGHGGIGLHREPDQPFRLFDLPGLVAENSERMKRLEMAGLRRQHFAIDSRCVRKPSSAPQLQGILQPRIAYRALASYRLRRVCQGADNGIDACYGRCLVLGPNGCESPSFTVRLMTTQSRRPTSAASAAP